MKWGFFTPASLGERAGEWGFYRGWNVVVVQPVETLLFLCVLVRKVQNLR